MNHQDRLDIDRIAFFGRTYAEYVDMFGLDEQSLFRGPVLDCPAGASSFAAEAHTLGLRVTACDILYGMTADELLKRGREDIEHVFDRFDQVAHLYTWNYYTDKEMVMALRIKALKIFTGDFTDGLKQGRYIQAEFPRLPFRDRSFPLVLSGNFLFLYGDRLDFDFHVVCIGELLRVSSGEVRIFPLLGLDFRPYPHLDRILDLLKAQGVSAEVALVPFEFQRGADRMLRITAAPVSASPAAAR